MHEAERTRGVAIGDLGADKVHARAQLDRAQRRLLGRGAGCGRRESKREDYLTHE